MNLETKLIGVELPSLVLISHVDGDDIDPHCTRSVRARRQSCSVPAR
jgi:hypothetical protein